MFDFLETALKNRVDPAHYTPEERNMLSVAFKNLITPKRSTWRHIVSQKQESDGVTQYKAYIEQKLHNICMDIVNLVQ